MAVDSLFYNISTWILPIIFAVTLHEFGHAWVAWKLGDDTAFKKGRVTFNPIRHIDLFGTIIMPSCLLLISGGKMSFGYAKPVPVNFWALSNLRRDMVLVALAGPASNLILAFISTILLRAVDWAPSFLQSWLEANLVMSIFFNLMLCIFNMIPILPLDGGRVAVGILPPKISEKLARLEPAGFAIILILLFVLPWVGVQIGYDLNLFMMIVATPSFELYNLLINFVGVN